MKIWTGWVLALGLMACTPEAAGPTQDDAGQGSETGLPSRGDADFTVADLTALIEARGPQDAVLELASGTDRPQWDAVIAGIGTGDQAWLDTVPLMADGLDGEAYTMVSGALSQALATNAAGVLRLTPAIVSVEEVCFPDPPYEDPAEEAASNVRHAQKLTAVRAISDPALAAARSECLGWLDPA